MIRTFSAARPPLAARIVVCAACLAAFSSSPTRAQPSGASVKSDTSIQSNASQQSGISQQSDASAKVPRPDPYDALRSARMIFIRSKSVFFNPRSLEQALVNRDEFQDWELVVTRDESEADLVIEVSRKSFTNRFVYNVIDRRAGRILAGGRIGSLGGTVEGQIADSFIKKLRRVRAGGRPTNEE